jgi:hypothetical protein
MPPPSGGYPASRHTSPMLLGFSKWASGLSELTSLREFGSSAAVVTATLVRD